VFKEPVEERAGESLIVGDALVELEVGVDHVLQMLGNHAIEGQAGVFWGVDLDAGGQRRVAGELLHQVNDDNPVLFGKVGAKALVEIVDDLGQRLDSVGGGEILGLLPPTCEILLKEGTLGIYKAASGLIAFFSQTFCPGRRCQIDFKTLCFHMG
jgi:hypothetical protein